jgi:hypothetical protein
MEDSLNNYSWILETLVQIFIAYHVVFLSKKLSNKGRLEHRENIKTKIETLVSKGNSEVYLVNINRYFKDYPSNTERYFQGYSHLRAELKQTSVDGIEVFSGSPREVYRNSKGKLSFKGKDKEKVFTAFPVGLIPYDWIEYIDVRGDEFGYVPLIYCHYKGKTNWKFWKKLRFYGFPYKKTIYYRKNEHYDDKTDPQNMRYTYVGENLK